MLSVDVHNSEWKSENGKFVWFKPGYINWTLDTDHSSYEFAFIAY